MLLKKPQDLERSLETINMQIYQTEQDLRMWESEKDETTTTMAVATFDENENDENIENDGNIEIEMETETENEIGKCCFCGDECNPMSQCCGRCMRGM